MNLISDGGNYGWPDVTYGAAYGMSRWPLQCHNATPGGEASSAPNLWGVFGRRIAGTKFDGYSTTLKARSGNWNDATLDAFLSDVQGFSPGSTMAFPGISDAAIRATVIDYLKALTPASGHDPGAAAGQAD